LAARYAKGLESASVLREEGRDPELVPAAPGRETVEALRKVLHRLTVNEGLAPWQIAVLTGRSLAKSDVWRQRVFGNQVLWNGSYDEAGHSLGLSADRAPDQPTDTILFDSISCFKGRELEVVMLVDFGPARIPGAGAAGGRAGVGILATGTAPRQQSHFGRERNLIARPAASANAATSPSRLQPQLPSEGDAPHHRTTWAPTRPGSGR
jgi:hypothetical protein